jgi:hypothetical protein
MSYNDVHNTDLQSIFTASEFGTEISHENGALSETLIAMLDVTDEILLNGGVGLPTGSAAILLRTDDMANVDQDSTFTVSGAVYHVMGIGENVSGVARITLSLDEL